MLVALVEKLIIKHLKLHILYNNDQLLESVEGNKKQNKINTNTNKQIMK